VGGRLSLALVTALYILSWEPPTTVPVGSSFIVNMPCILEVDVIGIYQHVGRNVRSKERFLDHEEQIIKIESKS